VSLPIAFVIAAFGFALVLEGLVWAIAPDMARRMAQLIGEQPKERVQAVAFAVCALGFVIAYLALRSAGLR
jgi:Uncharacterized protein conserved in bacteria (DUF2065).